MYFACFNADDGRMLVARMEVTGVEQAADMAALWNDSSAVTSGLIQRVKTWKVWEHSERGTRVLAQREVQHGNG